MCSRQFLFQLKVFHKRVIIITNFNFVIAYDFFFKNTKIQGSTLHTCCMYFLLHVLKRPRKNEQEVSSGISINSPQIQSVTMQVT